jgi:hypothetical protein
VFLPIRPAPVLRGKYIELVDYANSARRFDRNAVCVRYFTFSSQQLCGLICAYSVIARTETTRQGPAVPDRILSLIALQTRHCEPLRNRDLTYRNVEDVVATSNALMNAQTKRMLFHDNAKWVLKT